MIDPTPTEPRKHRPQRRRVPASQRPSLRLTDRDRDIFKAIWQNRFLTRSLLTALFPPESGAASSDHTHLAWRLQGLYQHRYLDRLRAHPTAEIVYALGPHGAKELLARSVPIEDTDWEEKNRRIKELYIEHALMVARLRVALTLAVRDKPSLTLERFEREHKGLKIVWNRDATRWFVNPDALFVFRDAARREGSQHYAYLVEADRSTMVLERVLAKYWAYVRCYTDRQHSQLGIANFRVLTIAKTAQRASHIQHAAALRIPPEHHARFLFTTEQSYAAHPTNVLAPVWRNLSDQDPDDPTQRRFLTSSPLPRL